MKFALLSSLALVACLVHATPVQLPRVLSAREVDLDVSNGGPESIWVRQDPELALVGREVDLDVSIANGPTFWARRNPESALVGPEIYVITSSVLRFGRKRACSV
ncbi:hypothetical protein BYT27DRAFT_7343117 [Phlegmacium glaucopus]|nr:hypothetical protein BYT27DRAFT_7343117 [Phlegmacium glaucopus]